jgi:hypothetical protein
MQMFRSRLFCRALVTAAIASVAAARPALAQLEGAHAAEVRQVIDDARARGLPTEPILERVAMGTQLRRSGSEIVDVARREARRLAEVQAILGAASPVPDLMAGTKALADNIPAASIREVRGERPSGSVAVPLGVLVQLKAFGLPVREATRTVVNLMRMRASDERILTFAEAVERDHLRRGYTIDAAVRLNLVAVFAVLPGGSAAATALAAEGLSMNLDPRITNPGFTGSPTIIKRPPLR